MREDSGDFARVVTRQTRRFPNRRCRMYSLHCVETKKASRALPPPFQPRVPRTHPHSHVQDGQDGRVRRGVQGPEDGRQAGACTAGICPAFRGHRCPRNEKVAHVSFFHARAGFSSRASRSGAQSSRRRWDRALGAPLRARLSRPTSHARARVPDRPDPVDAARSRIGLRFERTPAVASSREELSLSDCVFSSFVAPTADAPDPPLASFRHLSTHTSFWWTSPRLGAARAR